MEEKVSILVVGEEKSKFAGNCPGSEKDARGMASLFKDYSQDITVLLNENATVDNVKNELAKIIKSDLAILYYSGHGGSKRFIDTGPDEDDGKDEFLCLYDDYLKDNEIWNITSKSNGRVFEIFDCCHSQTMFRIPGFVPKELAMPRGFEGTPVNLLVWSGCPDNTYSYGSSAGGQFTNTILKYFNPSDTYDGLWRKISSDINLKKYEKVQKTILGSFPEENKIFK